MNKRNNYNKNASDALYAGQNAAKKVKKDLERQSQNECIASLLIEASDLLN